MIDRTKLTRVAIAAFTAGSLALAASALAEVAVYENDFSSQGKFREIERSGGGKRCDKKYREKSKVMLASVKRNPTTCSFRPPVQGDDSLPNHGVSVDAKVLKNTTKSVRGSVFIETTVRAGGGGTGYSLRIFPERKRYELSRGPAGAGFPKSGKSSAIKKVNERNRIEIIATGAEISRGRERQGGGEGRRLQPGSGAGAQGALRARLPVEEEEQEGRRDLQAGRGLGPQPLGPRGSAISTETIERTRGVGPGSGLGGNWRVIVLNDDHNTFEHVAKTLARVIPGVSLDRGHRFADQIHNSGQAIVWSGEREPAELYWEQLKDAGLTMAPLESG